MPEPVWALHYEADFPEDRTGDIGPLEGFSPTLGTPNYDLIVNSVQGWGDWLHPVQGGKPRQITFMAEFPEANWQAARNAQEAALELTGTVGTLTLQFGANTAEVFSNMGIQSGGVGEPFLWITGYLILPLAFVQGGEIT